MELCYDGALVLPSSYVVMDEEEMTYLEGGNNVYPMSRTFSFLFSKYLDTKFYGIPGFIQ